MFDCHVPPPGGTPDLPDLHPHTHAAAVAAVLDALDVPLLLVSASLQLRLANRAARARTRAGRAALAIEGTAIAAAPAVRAQLCGAVGAALASGRHTLLVLEPDTARETLLGVVPMPALGGVLLVLGRDRVLPELAVYGYARAVRLTPSETEVLRSLCEGESPEAIARRRQVRLSTVRTQLRSLRIKMAATDLRHLVRKAAALPAVMSCVG